jgi:hypothetical protein
MKHRPSPEDETIKPSALALGRQINLSKSRRDDTQCWTRAYLVVEIECRWPTAAMLACPGNSPAVTRNPVEHSCYQCGLAVDEGIAFCPQCNAPQIRVAVGDAVVSPTIDSGSEVKPTGSHPNTSQITVLQWSYALPAAALAGLIAAVMMLIPVGAFGLGMLASGALAVMFYRRRNPVANVTPGTCARKGALCGSD